MITEEIQFPSSEQGETIYGKMYLPYGEVKGILQFAPGMCDYGDRYEELFRELIDCGYIAAYADHLGHGRSLGDMDDLGFFAARDGYRKVTEDFAKFYDILDEKFPEERHYIMGHSMGSFVVRYFMSVYRKANLGGAIMMGTAGPNPLAGVGIVVAAAIALVRGGYYRSTLLEKMAFGSFNKRIEDPVSLWDWLSRDDDAAYNFDTDELRNETFTAAGFKDVFSLLRIVNTVPLIEDTPKELPLLLISGAEDPLGNYGRGIQKLEDTFSSLGFRDVESVLFPEARHELCHELNRLEVFDAIIHWLDRHVIEDLHLTFPEDDEDAAFDFEDDDGDVEAPPAEGDDGDPYEKDAPAEN